MLATQGVRVPLTERFVEQLATAQTGDGRPLAVAFRTRLEHEWAHLEAIEARLDALTAARDEHIATGTDRVATTAGGSTFATSTTRRSTEGPPRKAWVPLTATARIATRVQMANERWALRIHTGANRPRSPRAP